MKKTKYILLILLCSFTLLVGCSNKKEESSNNTKEPEIVDETLFKINGKEFHMDKDKDFYGLKYTTSKDFREINNATMVSEYVQYDYQPEDELNYLYLRLFYYPGKDFNYAKENTIVEDLPFTDGKTDNIEYKMIDENRTDGIVRMYFINNGGNTYVVYFASRYDIKDFETKVINSLKF